MAKLLLDGYDVERTIGPVHGLPAVQIKFRPALPERVTQFLKAPVPSAKAEMQEKIKFIQEHLIGWDVESKDGSLAEITSENIAKVPYPYIARFIDEIASMGVGADSKN